MNKKCPLDPKFSSEKQPRRKNRKAEPEWAAATQGEALRDFEIKDDKSSR